jgi:hypothetical protein
MLHTQLAALALAAMATVASGCGSSKTGSATTAASTSPTTTAPPATVATGKPLSRARWIAAGDAICESTQTKVNALHGRTSAELLRDIPQAAVYYAAEAESMSKLVPPKSMAHDWETIVDDVHVYGEYTNTAIQNAKEHHGLLTAAFREKIAKLQASMIATAKRDGFKWCSIGE